MKTIEVRSSARCEMIDITRDVARCVRESGVTDGLVCIFVPHTTAGITINENADPDVRRDLLFALERAVPNAGFFHIEDNSDAHAKATMTGFSVCSHNAYAARLAFSCSVHWRATSTDVKI